MTIYAISIKTIGGFRLIIDTGLRGEISVILAKNKAIQAKKSANGNLNDGTTHYAFKNA